MEDNELLIRSPYTNYVRSVILTVISQPMFNLETLPPSLPILVFKYISSCFAADSPYFEVLKILFDLTFESILIISSSWFVYLLSCHLALFYTY